MLMMRSFPSPEGNPIDPFQKDFFSPSLVCCVKDLHEDGGDDDDVGVKASFHM